MPSATAPAEPINLDIIQDIITTNNLGNYFLVLSNLDNSLDGNNPPPHYYRYETGTSMAAADVSGVLALMQDYFTNTLQTTPSPALLKAMLINGARRDRALTIFRSNNSDQLRGLGPDQSAEFAAAGNRPTQRSTARVFRASSWTKARPTRWPPATAIRSMVTINTNTDAQYLPLRVTLAWTDPPGDPAAAIKLVNSLELVVTNLDDSDQSGRLLRQRHSGGQHLQHAGNAPTRRRILIPSTTSKTSSSRRRWARTIPSPSSGARERQRRHRRSTEQRGAGLRAGDFLRRRRGDQCHSR